MGNIDVLTFVPCVDVYSTVSGVCLQKLEVSLSLPGLSLAYWYVPGPKDNTVSQDALENAGVMSSSWRRESVRGEREREKEGRERDRLPNKSSSSAIMTPPPPSASPHIPPPSPALPRPSSLGRALLFVTVCLHDRVLAEPLRGRSGPDSLSSSPAACPAGPSAGHYYCHVGPLAPATSGGSPLTSEPGQTDSR